MLVLVLRANGLGGLRGVCGGLDGLRGDALALRSSSRGYFGHLELDAAGELRTQIQTETQKTGSISRQVENKS